MSAPDYDSWLLCGPGGPHDDRDDDDDPADRAEAAEPDYYGYDDICGEGWSP